MNFSKSLVIACVALFASGWVVAQNVVSFRIVDPPSVVHAGDLFDIVVRAEIEPGWHLYSMTVPDGGPVATTITVEETDAFKTGGPPVEPPPIPWFDQNFGMETNYFESFAEFSVPISVKATAPAGSQTLAIKVRFMVCNDTSCLPPQTKTLSTEMEVQGGAPASAGAGSAVVAPGTAKPAEVKSAGTGATQEANGLPAGTLAYIWFAMSMGALALLTPCVFPMIPITVSYFTKRDAKSRGRAVFEAGLYSLGIIATFTFLGFLLTFLFGAGGINRLAANPAVNFLIAAVFIVFALSLFGVLEIGLPSSWLSAISKKSTQSTGLLGILLMALTFSLTSFTCTVPFVGTVMVAALQGDFLWSLLGVTAFAAVFSLPFFLLALFPSWLQSLPKSGNWMNSVKITMGFLELAAAMKFLSNVDLVFQWQILTRPVFITIWLAIGLVTTVYLLGWFRFAHEGPSDSLGALRVLFAIFFLAVSLFLFRGLFGFNLGELDAFLPPRDYGVSEPVDFTSRWGGREAGRGEQWLSDYDEALRKAAAEGKPVFVDFTGYTCTNCRWMEANIFTLPEVQKLFDRYVLVRLYTDGTKPEHDRNRRMEEERFSTIALPFYALISPDDKTIASFPGLTRDKAEFVRFLESGLS